METGQRIARSTSNRVLAGVCGGIAQQFGWSATRLRVVYVLLTLLSAAFPGVLIYLALWILIPEEDRRRTGADGRRKGLLEENRIRGAEEEAAGEGPD